MHLDMRRTSQNFDHLHPGSLNMHIIDQKMWSDQFYISEVMFEVRALTFDIVGYFTGLLGIRHVF